VIASCAGTRCCSVRRHPARLRANTHWLARDQLTRFGAIPTDERVVEDGKVITAAGVSSGIDTWRSCSRAPRRRRGRRRSSCRSSTTRSRRSTPAPPAKAPAPIQDMVRAPLVERDKRMAQRSGAP
jgi:transcriptional regulator GlxA family with amidase domain